MVISIHDLANWKFYDYMLYGAGTRRHNLESFKLYFIFILSIFQSIFSVTNKTASRYNFQYFATSTRKERISNIPGYGAGTPAP